MLTDFPLDPSEISGGVQSAAYNLVTALAKYTDASITTLSFSYDVAAYQLHAPFGNSIRIIRVPQQNGLNTLTRYYRQRQVVKRVIQEEKPDIVHAQSEGFYATLAVRSGAPNVYTVHGVGLKEIELQRPAVGQLRSLLRARLIRAHHRRAKHIITINNYTRNEISRLHNARVWQIPNAVDESFFDLGGAEVEGGRILMVGGVSRRKDTLTALKAVRRLLPSVPNLRLDVVGPIATDYRITLQSVLGESQLSEHVFLHGLVSREDLRAHYRAADIFLLTSIEESSPIAIVEAMAAGKPIVATDAGGVAEIVEHGVNGYVCRIGDDEEIARELSGLVLDRALRSQFAQASQERAAARWSSRAVALATYDAYKEILGDS